jgi:allantoicase
MFFGSRHHLILPGESRGMHDGWETRRRRGPGHDWALVRLAARGVIERAVVDTSHFKGNAPGTCALYAADAQGLGADALAGEGPPWRPLLATSPLEAHRVHVFTDALAATGPATHVRLRIDPDGGVARLRLFGRVDAAGREALALLHLDALLPGDARAAFHACLGAARWAEAMAAARPFGTRKALEAAAERAMNSLLETDWREAFAAHPRIGEAPHAGTETERRWAHEEQSRGASAPERVRLALAEGNRAYEAKFGWVFLICASGKPAEEMLAALEARLHNDARTEFPLAVEEQKKITRLRMARLLTT